MSLDHHREEPTATEPILAPFSFHRDSLDHGVIFGARHLRRILTAQ